MTKGLWAVCVRESSEAEMTSGGLFLWLNTLKKEELKLEKQNLRSSYPLIKKTVDFRQQHVFEQCM